MGFDAGLAEILREDLADLDGVAERKMFGGLCFMYRGHMLCGIYGDTAEAAGMFRVGKAREDAACALPGVMPMQFTKRRMGGLVDMDHDGFADDEARAAVLALALAFNAEQTPK